MARVLSESGYENFDVVEPRRVLKDGGSLQRAVDYLNAARRLVASDPPSAVGICRLLVEALDKRLRDQEHGTLTAYLKACTDKRRGEQYGRIVAAVKQLASMNHHDFGRDSVFTRPEALALVRHCEAFHMETINASYFKARCLKILDRVRDTGERIVILKRGRPVAELGPPSRAESEYPQSELKGTVTVVGDIVGPVVPEHYWDSLKGTGGVREPGDGVDAPGKQSRRPGGE